MLDHTPRVSAKLFREIAIINLDDKPIMLIQMNASGNDPEVWTGRHMIVDARGVPPLPASSYHLIASRRYGYIESIIEDVEQAIISHRL